LGDVNELAGRYEEADRAYAIARRCAGDPVGTARLMHKQGQLRERAGQYSSALRWFARALRVAEAGSEEQHANRAELALAYGGVRYRQGRYVDCVQWTREAVHAAERAGDRKSLAHALDLWDLALLYWKEGTREHEQGTALAIYQEIGDLIGQSSALNNLGIAAYQDGRWDEARTLYERSRAASEQAGDVNGTATALFNLGEILHDQGHVDDARRALSDARRIWRSARYPIGVAVATLHLGRTEMRAGNLPEALALLDDSVAQFRAISGSSFVHDARIRRVECLLLLGRSDDALMEADAVHAEIGEGATDPLLRVALHRARARARLGTGDAVSALALAEEAMARALAAGAPYELAETLLTRADVLDALGRADAAADRSRGAHLFAELSVVDRADVH
jgi:tetratricopeptide (TPR) repeat protein